MPSVSKFQKKGRNMPAGHRLRGLARIHQGKVDRTAPRRRRVGRLAQNAPRQRRARTFAFIDRHSVSVFERALLL